MREGPRSCTESLGRPGSSLKASDETFHRPVMVNEVLAQFEPAKDGEIMDGTVGGGGHSRALLERYRACRVIAVDQDPEALEAAKALLLSYIDRVSFKEARFHETAVEAGAQGPSLAGAFLDLGVSAYQLDRDDRGFSFRDPAPLDMRMAGAARGDPTAADLLNSLDEGELGKIFREYGEERRWRRLARAVTLLRGDRPFRVAAHLTEAIAKALRKSPTNKEKAKVFQALRVAVNDELEGLRAALPALLGALRPMGVLVVIAYESLTDRTIKEAFRSWSCDCVCPPGLPVCVCRGEALGRTTVKGAVRPSEAEISQNPRARSARLRAWIKAA